MREKKTLRTLNRVRAIKKKSQAVLLLAKEKWKPSHSTESTSYSTMSKSKYHSMLGRRERKSTPKKGEMLQSSFNKKFISCDL